MIAEKAALLGRGTEEEEPTSPMEERRPLSPISKNNHRDAQPTPIIPSGDLNLSLDPLSSAVTTTTTTTPTAEVAESEYQPQPMSEKARGKLRATESVTSLTSPTNDTPEIPDAELMKVAADGVGPNGYVPTQEWVSSWQKG